MESHVHLTRLLVFVIYPLWLFAGAIDYVCHRRTHIETTSGLTESWLHIAQFSTMVLIMFGAVFLVPTIAVIVMLGITAVLHLVLAYIDTAYTERKRYISPLEQHAHGFLDVLPFVAVMLLAVLGTSVSPSAPWFSLRPISPLDATLLMGSFLVLAGAPVAEEFLRTATNTRAERKEVRIASC